MGEEKMNRKGARNWIKIVDFVIIGGTLLTLLWLVGYARPLVISPNDNLNTTNTSVLFEFEKGKSILIDDNLQFSSPEKINAENNLVIKLKPGTYYWKVVGLAESNIRTLTIVSNADLKLRESEKGYEVVNGGNVPLDVDVYDRGLLVGKVVLGTEESKNATGNKFVGGQHGE